MKKIFITVLVLSSVIFAQSPEDIIKNNGCLACHAVASKKAAPAFAGIAMRNKRFNGANAKVIIMDSIKNGSKGKYPMFADSAMPAFKNLSPEELSTIADYILSLSSKAQAMHGKGKGNCGGGRGKGMGMGRGMM